MNLLSVPSVLSSSDLASISNLTLTALCAALVLGLGALFLGFAGGWIYWRVMEPRRQQMAGEVESNVTEFASVSGVDGSEDSRATAA